MAWRYYVHNVLLFSSNVAPYMMKADSVLNNLYTKLIHITCSTRALHRIVEKISGQFISVDELISNMQKSFLKLHTVFVCLNRWLRELDYSQNLS